MLGSVIDMQLSSSIIRDGLQSVLVFAGEIDLATVPECSDMITKFVDDHAGSDISVDMRQVSALDDTGVGVILGAVARARTSGSHLSLVIDDQHMRARFGI
jgi:anti-sigma B factor antagonist